MLGVSVRSKVYNLLYLLQKTDSRKEGDIFPSAFVHLYELTDGQWLWHRR